MSDIKAVVPTRKKPLRTMRQNLSFALSYRGQERGGGVRYATD